MKPYIAVMDARFRGLLQYRAAAAAGIVTRLFWGLIRAMVFAGFYRSTAIEQPMSYSEVVTYVWLGQGMLALILWGMDNEVRQMVRTGTVAYELLRPVDLYALWYSRSLAARAAPTFLQAIPVYAAAMLFFGMQPPPSWAAGAAWLASSAGALLLSSAFAALLSVSLFWTVSGEGAVRAMPALTYTLSGMLVPIPLLPGWAQDTLNFLPFRGLIDSPFRLYLGHIPAAEALPLIGHQLAWTAGLVLLGRWLMSRGLRQLVVQGG